MNADCAPIYMLFNDEALIYLVFPKMSLQPQSIGLATNVVGEKTYAARIRSGQFPRYRPLFILWP